LKVVPPFPVLYEDNHLLVIDKPAELPTMGVAEGVPSIVTLAKHYLKEKYRKPGNVFLGVVSRLDAPVTGVLILARTSKAASRLTEQFRDRNVQKYYWAMVEGNVAVADGELQDWVRKDERHRRMHIANPKTPGAQEARLTYSVIGTYKESTLLEIRLVTGRKHQIRLQWSSRGHPVVGDRKYGSNRPFPKGIALHSRYIELLHPVRREPLVFEAPLPAAWRVFGRIGVE
jgi:23S rRNA pseudouridine1911/1915/1917 synthase